MGKSEIANLQITALLQDDNKPKPGFVTFEPPNSDRIYGNKTKKVPTKGSTGSSKNTGYHTPMTNY